jgi:hypothetical protein
MLKDEAKNANKKANPTELKMTATKFAYQLGIVIDPCWPTIAPPTFKTRPFIGHLSVCLLRGNLGFFFLVLLLLRSDFLANAIIS